MDNDVQYPGEGENLVCYFEDGSFSIVSEKDLLPFDPNSEPYTTYMEGPNFSKFQKDEAVTLATLYFEKGAVPPSFKWLRNEDSGNASDNNGNNHSGINGCNNADSVGSDTYNTGDEDGTSAVSGRNTATNTKRHSRNESSNNVSEQTNSNKREGISKRDNGAGQRKDSISGQGKKNLIPTTPTSNSRTTKVTKPRSSSNANKYVANGSANNNSTLSKPTSNNNSNPSQQTNNKSSVNNFASTTCHNNANTNTSNQQSHQLSAAERVISSRTKQCSHCGEKTTTRANTNGDNKEPCSKLLCGECGELLNSFFNSSTCDPSSSNNVCGDGSNHQINGGRMIMAIFENRYYWDHYIEKKRKSPSRLWGNGQGYDGDGGGQIEIKILNDVLPVNKRSRWIDILANSN
ncbi:13636_t:CDS:2 [Acaulospora colombiana]|uniref:13636_t:CDS:1 n=1 Tax=Acaulospora colombiana TaxID=27376 RepID=A0ACA9LME2_9GLOM|nr:13636_t:CDS:2 [Acaulospora colombiana]